MVKNSDVNTATDNLNTAYRNFMIELMEYRNGNATPEQVKASHDFYNSKVKEFKDIAENLQYLNQEEFEKFLKKV